MTNQTDPFITWMEERITRAATDNEASAYSIALFKYRELSESGWVAVYPNPKDEYEHTKLIGFNTCLHELKKLLTPE